MDYKREQGFSDHRREIKPFYRQRYTVAGRTGRALLRRDKLTATELETVSLMGSLCAVSRPAPGSLGRKPMKADGFSKVCGAFRQTDTIISGSKTNYLPLETWCLRGRRKVEPAFPGHLLSGQTPAVFEENCCTELRDMK